MGKLLRHWGVSIGMVVSAVAFANGAALAQDQFTSTVTDAPAKVTFQRDAKSHEAFQFDLTIDTTTLVVLPARFGGGGKLTVTPTINLKVTATLKCPLAKKDEDKEKHITKGVFSVGLAPWTDAPLTAGNRTHKFEASLQTLIQRATLQLKAEYSNCTIEDVKIFLDDLNVFYSVKSKGTGPINFTDPGSTWTGLIKLDEKTGTGVGKASGNTK